MEQRQRYEDAQREEILYSEEEDEHEKEEHDGDDDDDDDEQELVYREVAVEGYDSKLFEVSLPERGAKKRKVWVFHRSLEYYLWGADHNSSNLHHCLDDLSLTASVRNLSKSSFAEHNMNRGQFETLMGLFNRWRKQIDPLTPLKARHVSMIPKQVAATVALHRTVRSRDAVHLLTALGQPVPQNLQNDIERRQHEAAGEVNLSLPDVDEETLDASELFEIALGRELVFDFDPEGSCGQSLLDEQKASRAYALQNPSTVLTRQLEEMKSYRTRVLNANRSSNKVLDITVQSDVGTMMRWLGWVSSCYEGSAAGALDFSIFRHPECTNMLEQFCEWLVEERGCTYGTVAGYCNSLLNLAQFAIGEVHETVNELLDDMLTTSLFNLRSQAECQYRDDARYRPLDPNSISWEDAQRTRIAAVQKFKDTALTTRSHEQRQARLKLAEDCCILAFHTYQPPDRVGVVRRLAIGETLIKRDDGCWAIDCTKFRHKTSKFYGPSITTLCQAVVDILEEFLRLGARCPGYDSLEFPVNEREQAVNRADKEYLFHTQAGVTHCYTSSNWTTRVKQTFKRHSPGSKATPPKQLRSSFIVALRNSRYGCSEVLKSAANCMKHSVETQGSDVYDKATHDRLNKAAFEWCEQFASRFESDRGEQEERVEEEVVTADPFMHFEDDEEVVSSTPPNTTTTTKATKRPVAQPQSSKPRKKKQPVVADTLDNRMSEANAEAIPSDDQEGLQIDSIKACEHTSKGLQYDLVWTGWGHVPHWWQSLPEDQALAVLAQTSFHKNAVIELEREGDARGERTLALVHDYTPYTTTWTLQFGDGSKKHFLLHKCCFAQATDRAAMSWKLSPEHAACTKNDSLIDWKGETLAAIRSDWDPASFPDYHQSKMVILAMMDQAVYDADDEAENVDSLSRVCEWLRNPSNTQLLLVRFLCESLRDDFMKGSLIRDSLQVMSCIQPRDLGKLKSAS